MPRTRIELELALAIDRDAGRLHKQVEAQLRSAIRVGSLAAGQVLPASRALAAELGVSRGVVVEAYAQLRAEGYLVSEARGTTRVASRAMAPRRAAARRDASPRPARWDLRPAGPDLSLFPRRAWARAVRLALDELPDAALGYPDPAGIPALRTELTSYLGRVRAVLAEPGMVTIVAGVAQGMVLAGAALVADGHERVAVEDPGHHEEQRLLGDAGLELVPLPVDADGFDVPALARSGVRAAMLTPAHQFPLGVVLSPERRAALLAWAQDVDGVVIEDDYDAEFRYDRRPVGALQGLAPDRVVHLGSVSKSVAPALRLGWAVAPERLAAAIVRRKRRADLGAPILEQAAFARLLRDGTHDRHLRAVRRIYRARRDALVGALDGWPVEGVAAGLHLVLPLRPDADERVVQRELLDRGVAVGILGEHTAEGGSARPALLLGYGRHAEDGLRAAVTAMGAALARHRPRP